ncbi:MAG: bifunctional diaminohydroxyphosphoribosylaminopyrimidine deaminase/5-amino-6-(5-phosphoribosylamino)uracil reductase RibD [bacterium]
MKTWTTEDLKFMREAIALAELAEGRTTPDPLVGAVLVKDGRIVSLGYHGEVTTAHAEAWAIDKAGGDVKGSILYVNLEPCSHYGNNPPCTDLILTSGIKEVVVAMKDPNPIVNGKGIRKLKKYGVKVRVGLLEEEARKLNEAFIKYMTSKRPYVVLKTAITLDGKIATKTGASRWVAGQESLKYAHHLRNVYDAILVGVNTVLVDNPKLTTRRVKRVKNPIRIVLDAFARTPVTADVVKTKGARTIIVVGAQAKAKKIWQLEKAGAEILQLPAPKGKIDLKKLLQKLGKMKIASLLIEGGGEVNASFLEAGLVDKGLFIIVPKIFGGRTAKTCVEGEGVKLPAQAKHLRVEEVRRLGNDILVIGYF